MMTLSQCSYVLLQHVHAGTQRMLGHVPDYSFSTGSEKLLNVRQEPLGRHEQREGGPNITKYRKN